MKNQFLKIVRILPKSNVSGWLALGSIRVPMRRHSWDQIISICLPQTIVLYPNPNIVTCTLRIWLREIGFALSYGALMLKTWR